MIIKIDETLYVMCGHASFCKVKWILISLEYYNFSELSSSIKNCPHLFVLKSLPMRLPGRILFIINRRSKRDSRF